MSVSQLVDHSPGGYFQVCRDDVDQRPFCGACGFNDAFHVRLRRCKVCRVYRKGEQPAVVVVLNDARALVHEVRRCAARIATFTGFIYKTPIPDQPYDVRIYHGGTCPASRRAALPYSVWRVAPGHCVTGGSRCAHCQVTPGHTLITAR